MGQVLLDWYDRHQRALPWRRTPAGAWADFDDEAYAYRVWISEIMLQQTQAITVIPYYDRFLRNFPTVADLARAPLGSVLKSWEGLGYYARARNLHAAARQIIEENGGRFPTTVAGWRALPGIGRYTAGAIASIALGADEPALDANLRRVLSRVFAVAGDPRRPQVEERLDMLARKLLPPGRAGDFNQALMDLGATICLPRQPRCLLCPWQSYCQALAQGEPEAFPAKVARPRVPHYEVAAGVIQQGDYYLVARRSEGGMLGGLWEFPGGKQEPGETLPECLMRELQEELGIIVQVGPELITLKHGYTHFKITLHAFACTLLEGEPEPLQCTAWRWATLVEIQSLPFPVTDQKIIRYLRQVEGTI
ncbi:MAG: A/G-specific adenine glycosylase [Chloroflexi bacterium]|nr:A/G-specific adenine glycosylase [Chloroflexota bacterium]